MTILFITILVLSFAAIGCILVAKNTLVHRLADNQVNYENYFKCADRLDLGLLASFAVMFLSVIGIASN